MSCHQRTFNKVMASVRKRHPNYGLLRRKNIVRAVVYARKK